MYKEQHGAGQRELFLVLLDARVPAVLVFHQTCRRHASSLEVIGELFTAPKVTDVCVSTHRTQTPTYCLRGLRF